MAGAPRAGALTGLMNQSTAQVIDGSLKFNKDKSQRLQFTPSVSGNRRTWTISYWYKNNNFANTGRQFQAGTSDPDFFLLGYHNSGYIQCTEWSTNWFRTGALLRDTGWYHIVLAWDSSQSTSTERWKFYINGVLQGDWTDSGSHLNYPSENAEDAVNKASVVHQLGSNSANSQYTDGAMAQVYFIDGKQLDASYFGFTDPLTNTWKPKKFDIRAENNPNNGTTWSNLTTASSGSFEGSFPKTNLFDGIASNSNRANLGTVGASIDIDFSSNPINVKNTISIWSGKANLSYSINGGAYVNYSDAAEAYKDIPFTGTLTSLSLKKSDEGAGASAIKIDGYILLDGKTDNSFYLPMDGNSPIGEDKSGKGNNWTPINFGGSVALDNPIVSGALPILNTTPGGTHASVGERTDSNSSNLVLALPLIGNINDVHHLIKGSGSAHSITGNGNVAANYSFSNFYGGSHYFDGSSDSLTAASSSDFGMGTGDFTIEAWVYPTTLYTSNFIVCLSGSDSVFGYGNDGTLNIQLPSSGAPALTQLGPVITNNKWNHFACVRESGALRGYVNGVLAVTATDTTDMGASGTATIGDHPSLSREIQGYLQDVRIYKGTAKYTSDFVVPATFPDVLPDTPSGVSGNSKLAKITDGAVSFDGTNDDLSISDSSDFTFGTNDFTIEFFRYKFENAVDTYVSKYGSGNSTRTFWFGQGSDGTEQFYWYNGSSAYSISSSASFPINRWSHLAAVRNSGTMTLYVDGVAQVSTTSNVNVSLNDTTENVRIGGEDTGTYDYNGFISNVRIVNGSAVYTSNFTPPTEPLTNVTNTKLLCCQSNTSATAAAVTPGSITANGDAAATNFNPFNTDINTVRGQETGYMTINPLSQPGDTVTLSNGNLDMAGGGTNVARVGDITVPSSGKWFWEIICKSGGSGVWLLGLGGNATEQTERLLFVSDQRKYTQSGGGFSTYGETYTTGDVIGVAVDMDADTLAFFKNGRSLGTAFSSISSTFTGNIYPYFQVEFSGRSLSLNSGQKPFKFPPPDGFQPLNAANVRPETVISRPDQYVGITTWTGDGNDNRNITLMDGFDLLWYKQRSGTQYHYLEDTIRGASKSLFPNVNSGQGGPDSTKVKNFTRDGIVVGTDGAINQSTEKYVAWTWKAGGRKNTFNVDGIGYASASAAGLDGGSINPTGASVGTKQGFSMITITTPSAGAYTVSHGLTKAPDFIIYRIYDQAMSWYVWHQAYGAANEYMLLNSTTDTNSGTYVFNNTLPSASVITDYSSNSLHHNEGRAMLYYSWHDVPGLQKFGSYVANGAADGNFVELGFRPALVWIKSESFTNSYTNWDINDSVRDTSNPADTTLAANLNDNENSGNIGTQKIDFLSNGFKIRQEPTSSSKNTDGETYIYCAWAEAPTIDLYGGGANAR